MNHEYRIIEGYGIYMEKRWELQKLGYHGWVMECRGTKEFCEEALQSRLNRISEGLEPTTYEQRRKELRETPTIMATNELPW